MADQVETSVPVLAVTCSLGAVILLLVLLCGIGKKSDDKEKESEDEQKPRAENGHKKQSQAAPKAKKEKSTSRKSRPAFSHPWLASTLKFHSGQILGMDFSPNGKYLVTCADDRSLLLWNCKELDQKEHKSIRGNVELDHAFQVKFSPDSKAIIAGLHTENTLRIFKLAKKSDGGSVSVQGAYDFPEKFDVQLLNIGISSTGRFIMTCYNDTTMKVWDLKGELLGTVATNQMNNAFGACSPCGRFIASSGFTPDVKVWEVVFDKGGNFQGITRAFELKGHTAGIYSFDFSDSSDKMATVSKDGTWKLFNTKIEYDKNQDPYLLTTGHSEHPGPGLIALSGDGRAVAIATANNVALYHGTSGKCCQKFNEVFTGAITAISFDNTSKFLLVAGDKHVAVFHNVVGHQATIEDLTEQKKKAQNTAHRERLQSQIDDAKSALHSLEVEA